MKRCSDLASRSEMQIEHDMNKTREVSGLMRKRGIGREFEIKMVEMKREGGCMLSSRFAFRLGHAWRQSNLGSQQYH